MRKTAPINKAVQAGLEYIAGQQLTDGGFKSFSSPHSRPFRPELTYRTVFTPSLILSALSGTDMPEGRLIRNGLAAFLRAQAGPEWTFNYWAKRTPERRVRPYPDDLDDTFCALTALYRHDRSVIDAKVLAKATKILLATEIAVGGPYRTWLAPADSDPVWLDVDLAVNSNVSYFLWLLGSPLPNLSRFIDKAITESDLRSSYYPSSRMPVYYMARGYNGKHAAKLSKIIRRLLVTSDTAQDIALCVSSLLRLGQTHGLDDALNRLLKMQGSDGAWPAAAFCLDPAIGGQPYYNGAAALTTAFGIEALQLYTQATHSLPDTTAGSDAGPDQDTRDTVLALAKQQCRELDKDLRSAMLRSLDEIATGRNGAEIIGLARRFNESLAGPIKKTPAGLARTLGLANLYGWLAYTIYDDFIDGEGRPEMISVANAALRRSLDSFTEALPADRVFAAFIRQTFDAIDSANAWELAHCRFKVRGQQLVVGKLPRYGNLAKLADCSLGHALPPMAILSAVGGIGPGDTAGQRTLQAFRHYLIARQLNDDAHDWPEDLQNGHITPVVAQVLSELAVEPGNPLRPDLWPAARRQFWRSTLPLICQSMRRHVRLSRQSLSRAGLFKPGNVIDGLLDGLDVSIADTLAQQSQAEDFLKHYRLKNKEAARP